jgi:hypothetical protein
MSGKAIKSLFALLFLVVGLTTVCTAGPKKQSNEKDPAAAAQTSKADGDKQKGKKLTLSEIQQPNRSITVRRRRDLQDMP